MTNKQVLFIADDFGMSAEANGAIIEAHLHGVLHGVSLMVGQPGSADAVRMARDHPDLPMGWHLHLDNSQPVTRATWPWGNSYKRAGWAIGSSRQARQFMRDEVRAQWDLVRESGVPCAFVNSHHHLHAHPVVYQTLIEVLGSSFNGWLRLGKPRFFSPNRDALWVVPADWLWMSSWRKHCPYRCTDTLWGLGRTFCMQAEEVARAIEKLGPGFHEFYFHPRAISPDDLDLRCLLELKKRGF